MKKIIFIIILVLILFLYRELPFGKPAIVDHFACSDNCPGPLEKYSVKVYKGVENKLFCWILGGKPQTYYGWGTYNICVVK